MKKIICSTKKSGVNSVGQFCSLAAVATRRTIEC